MNTINQYVRLHDGTCDIRNSSVLGAIRAKAIGFGPYEEEVRTEVAADRRISVAVVGQASEALRDESGKVIGTRWTTCYPMLSFHAKAGSTYFLDEKTILNADAASASCGISLRAVDASGRRETVDDAELKICPVGNL